MTLLSGLPLALSDNHPPMSRCYWVVTGKFLAGAYPGSPDTLQHQQRIETLWNCGLRFFVNLMEEGERNNAGQLFSPYDDILRELAPESGDLKVHQRFAVRDLSIPSIDTMRTILDAIDQSLATDRPVYLHCFGGVGRTGTVVCCWLLRHGFATAQNVVQLLGRLRQADRQTCDRPAPETAVQIRFVEQWRS